MSYYYVVHCEATKKKRFLFNFSLLFLAIIAMKSVIFTFVNKENNECISIGSMWYFQNTKKSCKQIVNALSRNHTEAERQAMMDCTVLGKDLI